MRLQLVLWYGALVAGSLGFFALLVFWLTANAVTQNIVNAARAEARVASARIESELSSVPPYWPNPIVLPAIDAYHDPGVVIEVIDREGNKRYQSVNNGSQVPIDDQTLQNLHNNQPASYVRVVSGERIQVEILPIHAPPQIGGQAANGGHVIGFLIVAKSYGDVDKSLLLLQVLLLLSGLIVLTGALVGGWAISARVLYPLGEVIKTARTISASARGTTIGNLSQRVQRPKGQDEVAQLVDTFNEMLAALQGATQAQRRFIADASHELRAPLTTVQGNLAFLQRHIEDLPIEERRTMLGDAHKETLRLAKLVDELLLLARADASVNKASPLPSEGEKEPNETTNRLKPVELDHSLLQLVKQLRGRMSVQGEKIKVKVGHIEPVRVRGDEESIRRVMLILLDNALKYTPTEGEKGGGEVKVSLERRGRGAILHVSDTGIGIDQVDLPHIFERFYRADRARTRQGTGLGLSIAQTLVEQLGGRISATSRAGKGSTFSVWLPLDGQESERERVNE